tara:strand:- start:1958 stop:2239 length:282 start_codon:yes stop_codon:yes gene_type:complete
VALVLGSVATVVVGGPKVFLVYKYSVGLAVLAPRVKGCIVEAFFSVGIDPYGYMHFSPVAFLASHYPEAIVKYLVYVLSHGVLQWGLAPPVFC